MTQEASKTESINEPIIRTPFDDENYQPLTFIPNDEVRSAVFVARNLLSKRNNSECIKLAKALAKMKQIIDEVERKAAFKVLDSGEGVDSVWLSEGKALMLWSDRFDLSELKIPNLKLHELFVVKVLMLCVEYTKIKLLDIESASSDLEKYRLTRLHHIADNQTMYEIIDCVARAEAVEIISSQKKAAKMLGSLGGQSRSSKIEPLKKAALELYIKQFRDLKVLTAANIIEATLREEQPELLALSSSENKARIIQNWIRNYLECKSQIPITIT